MISMKQLEPFFTIERSFGEDGQPAGWHIAGHLHRADEPLDHGRRLGFSLHAPHDAFSGASPTARQLRQYVAARMQAHFDGMAGRGKYAAESGLPSADLEHHHQALGLAYDRPPEDPPMRPDPVRE